MKTLPSSYDIIGDIVIVDLRDKKLSEKKVAEAIIAKNRQVKVVAKKVGKHSGKYRTQKLKIIFGEKRKETVHKENGVIIKLNVETCYFSQRSSTERARIAKLIKSGEQVLEMFSGVGPFPLVIAKHSKAKEITAIEINPQAHKYAEDNVRINKINNIKLLKGDVKKVLPKLKKKFDRIVMPLPKTAEEFLPLAKKYAKKGATIHYYTFGKEDEFEEIKTKLKKLFFKTKSMDIVKCGQYSPYVYRMCVDIKLP